MGSYSPPSSDAPVPLIQELTYKKSNVVAIALGKELTDPVILAQFDLTLNGPAGQKTLTSPYQAILGEGRQLAGAGGIFLTVGESTDGGTTWTSFTEVGYFTGAFEQLQIDLHSNPFSLDVTSIAIFAYAGDGTTSGEVRNVLGVAEIGLAPGDSVVQVV